MTSPTKVVIVGAGVAGLAAAWFLKRTKPPDFPLEITVLERSNHVGGKIYSDRVDGMLYEWGPHGILNDAEDTRTLVSELGLEPRIVYARDDMKKRYVLWNGRLVPVPTSPPAFLASPLLSFAAKLRALAEPFVKKIDAFDESVADFARRRLGKGVIEPLVEPAIAGIFAGDIERLSLRSAFPKLHVLEQKHGSILKGFARSAKERRARGDLPPTLISFRDGLTELPAAIERALESRVRTGTKIDSIARDGEGYSLRLAYPTGATGATGGPMRADVLILALSSTDAKELVRPFDQDLASNLGLISSAPVSVCCLEYERGQVKHPLDGFGFLCAKREKRAILGAIFASSVFDGHAPPGRVQLRTLLGGALNPQYAKQDDDALVATARKELGEILNIVGEPRATRVFRHADAIPQYVVGHPARLAAIDSQLMRHPRLYVCGASYRGVSVNDCIGSGRKIAGNVLRYLLNGENTPRM